jgi:two-component system sensor histidine kinase HydH
VLWLLSFAYLKRRSQAHQVGRLERFQSKLLDNMPDGLVTLGPGGAIVAANPSAMRLLDPECREEGCPLAGRSWAEFPFDAPGGDGGWRQYEYHGRRLEILAVPFREDAPPAPGGEAQLILIRDRTTIRHLEEDLEEARRLATIGSLAAGVAHEVRNPLSALRGFAQFFAEKFKGNKPYDEYAATMVQEADRLGRVVTDLLYLARPRDIAPQRTSLAGTFEKLTTLMRFDMEHKHVHPEADLAAPTVLADPDGLTQVLLNLVSNALDAVPAEGGRVRVYSRIVDETTEARGAGTGGPAEPGVVVGVEDNGPGIPEEDREHALEPFHTTKRKGTGLGLAIVNAILRAHHGRVRIGQSALGGARVELFFPERAQHTGDEDRDHNDHNGHNERNQAEA